MNNLIIIPTYFGKDEPSSFDHPTERFSEQTISALFTSTEQCNVRCPTVVIPSTFSHKFSNELKNTLSTFRLNTRVFTKKEFDNLKTTAKTFWNHNFLNLHGYGSVRNISLCVASAEQADNLIFLDDDEIIEGRHFIQIASAHMNQLGGKTGYYTGSNSKPSWWQAFWPVHEKMSAETDKCRIVNQTRSLKNQAKPEQAAQHSETDRFQNQLHAIPATKTLCLQDEFLRFA